MTAPLIPREVIGSARTGHSMLKGQNPTLGCGLFPLPTVVSLDDSVTAGLGRRQRRRLQRDTAAALRGLNYLHGEGHRQRRAVTPSDATLERVRLLHEQSLHDVAVAARRWIDVDCATPPREAHNQLLKGRGGYVAAAASQANLAPYEYSLLSVPECVADAPFLADILTAEACKTLEGYEKYMLRPREDVARIREERGAPGRHVDPTLLRSPRAYAKLVKRMHNNGMIDYTTTCYCELGVFFVWKKNGKIRLILDCRRANILFLEPPGVDLVTSEGLSRIEVENENGDDSDLMAALRVFLGSADVADCFHRMRLKGKIRRYFCWPPILAGSVGISFADGKRVEADEWIWPMSNCLPMGWTWSLHFAQLANATRMALLPCLDRSLALTDRGAPLVLRADGREETAHYVYVDNLGVISGNRDRVEAALHEAHESFDSVGLLLHETEVFEGAGKTLGVVIDGKALETRAADERFGNIRAALRWLLRRRCVAGWELEVILGHCTFLALVRRELLCVFFACYRFIQKNYWERAELWRTVRDELEVFIGLMVFAFSPWWLSWAPQVHATDSSLYGFGVSVSDWKPEEAAAVGRVLERRRWRLGGGQAREHALEAAGYALDHNTGTVTRVAETGAAPHDVEELLEAERWTPDPDFPEVPAELLRESRWKTVMADRWVHTDDILRLEARGVVKAVSRIANSRPMRNRRCVLLGDNMSVVLAFGRCRAKDFRLLTQVRRACALALSRGLRFYYRWIPTGFNSSDEGSRRFDPHYDGSKTLVHDLERLSRCRGAGC